MAELTLHSISSPSEGKPLSVQQVDMKDLDLVSQLNQKIFDEERIINSFDHEEVLMLIARWRHKPVGFKIGYNRPEGVFYSAKGGVIASYRRRGIARILLHELMHLARARGYRRFVYDTFPNKHPGMAVLGFMEGFKLTRAGYNTQYSDYRLRLEHDL